MIVVILLVIVILLMSIDYGITKIYKKLVEMDINNIMNKEDERN